MEEDKGKSINDIKIYNPEKIVNIKNVASSNRIINLWDYSIRDETSSSKYKLIDKITLQPNEKKSIKPDNDIFYATYYPEENPKDISGLIFKIKGEVNIEFYNDYDVASGMMEDIN